VKGGQAATSKSKASKDGGQNRTSAARFNAPPERLQTESIQYKWEDYRRTISWNLPNADTTTWGRHRGGYQWIRANGFRARIVNLPAGQTGDWHSADLDGIFMQMVGETECYVGTELYLQKPQDILMIPANNMYNFRNIGLGPSLFFIACGYGPPTTHFDDEVPFLEFVPTVDKPLSSPKR
jgi:mannose-6-phosphate isomerase-like protein (cupin superfamily)